MPTTIGLADLRALDACEEQVALFAATFPEGVTINEDNYRAVAAAAAAAGLDVRWYAEVALTPEERAVYRAAAAVALAAYEAPARAAYLAAVARALCAILAARP